MRRRRILFVPLAGGVLLFGAWLANAQPAGQAEKAYIAEITRSREEREHLMRAGPFPKLARVHVELLKDRARLTIGSGLGADLRLPGEGIAPLHAVIEGTTNTPALKTLGAALATLDNRSISKGSHIFPSILPTAFPPK